MYKMFNCFKRNKRLLNFLILVSFLVLSFISISILLYTNNLCPSADGPFHALRIHELYKSFLKGNWLPQFNLWSYNSDGVADLAFYPYLTLYPILILFYIFHKIAIVYFLYFMLCVFIAMIIAFYSSLEINHNYYISYLFAIIYSISMNFFQIFFYTGDIGCLLSMCFLPLAIFGTIKFIKYGKWLQMGIGITLILYSHIINFIFILIIISILLIINKKHIKKYILRNLIKVALLVLSLGSFYWCTFLWLTLHNHINSPSNKLNPLVNSYDPITKLQLYSHTLKSSFYVTGQSFISILQDVSSRPQFGTQIPLDTISIVSIILGIILFKKMDRLAKQLYLISIGLILLGSTLFPWNNFKNTFISKTLQFSWRLYIIPILLLSYLFAYLLIKEFKYKNTSTFIFTIIVIILMAIGEQIGYQFSESQSCANRGKITNSIFTSRLVGNFDYFPTRSLLNYNDILSTKGIYHNHKGISKDIYMKSKGNGKFSFRIPQNVKKLKMPFVMYNGINYTGKLDHKPRHCYSRHNTLIIHNIRRGRHVFQVKPHNPVKGLSFIMMVPGLLYLISVPFRKIYRRHKQL